MKSLATFQDGVVYLPTEITECKTNQEFNANSAEGSFNLFCKNIHDLKLIYITYNIYFKRLYNLNFIY